MQIRDGCNYKIDKLYIQRYTKHLYTYNYNKTTKMLVFCTDVELQNSMAIISL